MHNFKSMVNRRFWKWVGGLFSPRTIELMKIDLICFRLRRKQKDKRDSPAATKLHFGCGNVHVDGWLNVDMMASDENVDLGSGRLPWRNSSFEVAVSQHMIEHLDLETELLPLFAEIKRVLVPCGEIWLSCPDIAKICHSYLDNGMEDLLQDRQKRWSNFNLHGMPAVHLINHLFCQEDGHRNLFDFELLAWALDQSGFKEIQHVQEKDLLQRFPEFPARNDDCQSLYISAISPIST